MDLLFKMTKEFNSQSKLIRQGCHPRVHTPPLQPLLEDMSQLHCRVLRLMLLKFDISTTCPAQAPHAQHKHCMPSTSTICTNIQLVTLSSNSQTHSTICRQIWFKCPSFTLKYEMNVNLFSKGAIKSSAKYWTTFLKNPVQKYLSKK